MQSAIFAVGDEPYLLWEEDVAARTRDFLDGLDPKQNYCFSLARTVGSGDIEVIVVDQIVHRVDRLKVALHAAGFIATLSTEAASLLDGHLEYDIEFLPGDWSRQHVEEALAAIFLERNGLTVNGRAIRRDISRT